MNKKLQVLKYVIADILSALLAWNLFFFYRKISINHQAFHLKEQILIDNNLLLGIILIPIFWLILYLLIGTYTKIYRKSRLKEAWANFINFYYRCYIAFLCCTYR